MCDEAAWLDTATLRAVGPANEIVRITWDVVNHAEADRHRERDQGTTRSPRRRRRSPQSSSTVSRCSAATAQPLPVLASPSRSCSRSTTA